MPSALSYGLAMPAPSRNMLERLRCLNRFSPDFHVQLLTVLHGEEYQQCAQDLRGDGLELFVEYLDEVLGGLDPTSLVARTCRSVLARMCGLRMKFPISFVSLSSPLDICCQPVASGCFGDFYEGTLDGLMVSIKRVRISLKDGSGKAAKALCEEAVLWKHLRHPNIVPFRGVTLSPLQLISEWMPGGDLREYIQGHPDTNFVDLLRDVAIGLAYIHSCGIIHGDLKCQNILVDSDGRARIGGLGAAMVAQSMDSVDAMRVASYDQGYTARWTAPEILTEQGTYSQESDVFSFAMVMVEVFTGANPFNDSLPSVAMLAIMDGKRPSRPTSSTFTDKLWMLTQCCWDQDPRLRPKISEVLRVLNSGPPAWKRLINRPPPVPERIPLINFILSYRDEADAVERLSGDDAQDFIDLAHECMDSLSPGAHERWLRSLRKICGRQALLPRSLEIPLCYNPMDVPLCHGGSADVWKGQHHGRDAVVKVYQTNDFEQIRKRLCREVATWNALRHPNVLPLLGVTMSNDQFAVVSVWMQNGNINKFVEAFVDVDRLKLLREVARGLIYLHNLEIIHGDLKGANILIDNTGRARLADFGILEIVSDQPSFLPSCIRSGTTRWMSPELLDPGRFGLEESCPTVESDIYAFGMVIYEVLTRKPPFALWDDEFVVILAVLDDKRPMRPQGPQGNLITDSIWDVVQSCWGSQPGDRSSIEAALLGLEGDPSSSVPSSPNMDRDAETDTDDTASESSLRTALSEKELPDSRATSPTILSHGSKFLGPPQEGRSKEIWARRLVRNARRMFRIVSRKLWTVMS